MTAGNFTVSGYRDYLALWSPSNHSPAALFFTPPVARPDVPLRILVTNRDTDRSFTVGQEALSWQDDIGTAHFYVVEVPIPTTGQWTLEFSAGTSRGCILMAVT